MKAGKKLLKQLVPISRKISYNTYVIKFLPEKEYVIITIKERLPYYENLKESFSLKLEIFTLEGMINLFENEKHPEKHFIDKEIIISGYKKEGDIIAHYLNSLSGNMAIGYELEN